MELILAIVVLVLLFGGGGYWGRRRGHWWEICQGVRVERTLNQMCVSSQKASYAGARTKSPLSMRSRCPFRD